MRVDVRMDAHTTIKIGGPVECWFEPQDDEALAKAVGIAHQTGCPVHVVGGGSNLLASDRGLEGLTVHLRSDHFRELRMDGEDVVAGAAVPLSQFLQFLVANDLGDCEFLMGIPAQVGGAVMMNAGSGTKWIGSHVKSVRAVTPDGRQVMMRGDEIPFDYRSSGLHGPILSHAVFRFPRVAASETLQRLSVYSDYRRKTQDLKFPNAGCMFRNPPGGKSAGQLIEEAGLKGRRVGNAQVSELHANFVINLGGATREDVLAVIALAEETVAEKFGIRLKREIKVLG